MKSIAGGLSSARLCGVVSLAALVLAGCGTHVAGTTPALPGSAPSSTSGAATAGAQLGLIWSPSDATLRPLIGVPGAVRLGAPLFAPGAYANAAYSAAGQMVLLLDTKGDLQAMSLPSLQPSTITRGLAAGSNLAFSPRGQYAIAFTPGATSLTLLSGLSQQVTATTVNAGGPLRGAAVSDQGTVAGAIAVPGAGVNLVAIPSSGARSTLASLGGFGGAAFLPSSDDLLFADSVANTVVRLHSGAAATLATKMNGLNQPFAVAASADARWAVVANRANSTLLRLDLTGASQPLPSACRCSPAELLPLAGNALFEVAAPGLTTGWMIEADDSLSRVLFIPPARSGQ